MVGGPRQSGADLAGIAGYLVEGGAVDAHESLKLVQGSCCARVPACARELNLLPWEYLVRCPRTVWSQTMTVASYYGGSNEGPPPARSKTWA